MIDVFKYVKETDTEEELRRKAYALFSGDGAKVNTRAALAVCEYAEKKGYESCAIFKGHILYGDSILCDPMERRALREKAMEAFKMAGKNGDLTAITELMNYYMDPREGDDLEQAIYWREKMKSVLRKRS